MILLAMVLALLLDSFVPHADKLKISAWHWLEHNALAIATRGFPSAPLVITVVVILSVPLLLLISKLLLPDQALITLAFETAALWFALGPRSLYQELQSGSGQLNCSSVLRWRNQAEKSPDTQLISESFYRLFLPIMWYLVGGSIVATTVRALVVFCDQHDTLRETDEHSLIKLINWLIIVPAWLMVMTFGLMGRLSETWHTWQTRQQADQEHVVHRLHQLELSLGASANAAVDKSGDLVALGNLVQRSLIAWLALTAVFTLGGVIA